MGMTFFVVIGHFTLNLRPIEKNDSIAAKTRPLV